MPRLQNIGVALTMAAASQAGCDSSVKKEDPMHVVTETSLSWSPSENIWLRDSREGEAFCIQSEAFKSAVKPGDRVRLLLDKVQKEEDGCLPVAALGNISEEHQETSNVICEVEGSIDQSAYVELVTGVKPEDLAGISLMAEGDDRDGYFQTWWVHEGKKEDMINPPVIATREDPMNGGPLYTYQYSFALPSNLVPFTFEHSQNLFPKTYIAADYWTNSDTSVFLSFESCRVE